MFMISRLVPAFLWAMTAFVRGVSGIRSRAHYVVVHGRVWRKRGSVVDCLQQAGLRRT